MNNEERFMYDLLLSELDVQEEEERFMQELLEEEFEAGEEEFDREMYEEEEIEDFREIESEYSLDPFWPDDDWLDAGEEWELSPDYGED